MTDISPKSIPLQALAGIANAYKRLSAKNGGDARWPELKLVAANVTSAGDLSTVPDIGWPGWARFASDKHCWTEKKDIPTTSAMRMGEWLVSGEDHTSLHVRPDPAKPIKLATWRYAHRILKEGDALIGSEFPALVQSTLVLQHQTFEQATKDTVQKVLRYDVYWGGEDFALRRLFSRFAGFETALLAVRQ